MEENALKAKIDELGQKMFDAARIADRLWYRKTMKALTKQQLEAELDAKLKAGEITAEEAEMEYQDWMHRNEVWSEW